MHKSEKHKKESIGIIINSLKSGGAEKQSILLANTLADDYDVYFIVIDWSYTVPKLRNLIDPRVNLIKLSGFSIKNIVKVAKVVKGKRIEHLFTFLTMSAIFGNIISRLAHIKHVYGSVRNSRLPRIKTIIELILANYFSYKTIHNSYSGEAYFKAKGMKNNIVIPNCYTNILPARQRSEKNTVIITTIGRFVEQKDYATALKAVKHLSDSCNNFVFQIIGWGELESYIRDKIDEFGLTGTVKIYINPNNTKELLHKSDIYLSTSLFEGTSNAIMEALDESLPVVATDAGDNNYLVQNGINGYICKIGDASNISSRLSDLVLDAKLRNKMGNEGNRILRENYSESIFKERYIQLITGK